MVGYRLCVVFLKLTFSFKRVFPTHRWFFLPSLSFSLFLSPLLLFTPFLQMPCRCQRSLYPSMSGAHILSVTGLSGKSVFVTCTSSPCDLCVWRLIGWDTEADRLHNDQINQTLFYSEKGNKCVVWCGVCVCGNACVGMIRRVWGCSTTK